MKCVNSIVIKLPNGSLQNVNCQNCVPCLITRQEMWVGRCRIEQCEHNTTCMVNLTYAENPLLLNYDDFQKFMKRLRKKYPKQDFRYAVCGEYGEQFGRPHWHAIIFGLLPQENNRYLDDIWTHGSTKTDLITVGGIRYVAGYCLKRGYDPEKPKIWRTSRRPGIGLPTIRRWGALYGEIALKQTKNLDCWPAYFTIGKDSRYPLTQGALCAFKQGFLSKNPDGPIRNIQDDVTFTYMSDRMSASEIHYRQQKRADPYHGEKKARQTTL